MKDRDLVTSVILNHIRGGLSIASACHAAGVGRATFYRWLNSDKSLKSRLRKAEADCIQYHLENIKQGSKADWRASAWFLERKYPKEYGRRVVHVQPKQTGETGILVRVPPPSKN